MLSKLFMAWALMALCVCIQAVGLASAFQWISKHTTALSGRFWRFTWLLIGTAGWVIAVHLVQIVIWALFFVWRGAIPDLPTAIYFSSVTYTTTGYGDIVLPEPWRMVGGVEALTGILMCGLSTGFFFAIFNKLAVGVRKRSES